MTRYNRTPEGPLIAGCGNYKNAATHGVIEHLLEFALSFRRCANEGRAQIDDSCARVDDVHDGLCELFGGCDRHLLAVGSRLRKDRPNKEATPGTDCRSRGPSPRYTCG
jgi:hypothetical protein